VPRIVPFPGAERRRPESLDDLPRFPIDSAAPVASLRKGLELHGYARMFVAALEIDFPRLVEVAIASLPAGLRSGPLTKLARSPDLPRGRASRLYGLITAVDGGDDASIRVRLLLPFRLASQFHLVLENSARRKDDPAVSYWVPLAGVRNGSITVVDADTVKLSRPFVVFRIANGVLSVEPSVKRK
jgi:hypothetical protein